MKRRNGHKAAVLWFTGLSGSGKSTVARQLERRLFELGCQTIYLDGDNVRHGLNGDLGLLPSRPQGKYPPRGRSGHAWPLTTATLTLCTFISPYRADRRICPFAAARKVALSKSMSNAIWKFVKRRDPKGLYAKALRGEIPNLPASRRPTKSLNMPEIVVETDVQSVEDIVEQSVEDLTRQSLLNF